MTHCLASCAYLLQVCLSHLRRLILFCILSVPVLSCPGVLQVPEGSGEQGKMEKTGCKIICGAPTTLAVRELMMMMMMISTSYFRYFFKCSDQNSN